MAFLIDTHIFIWCLFDEKKLSDTAKKIIENNDNKIFVSIITVWEMCIKISKNNLFIPVTMEQAIEKNNFLLLDIDLQHTLHTKNLTFHHKDPFDRMLISQAIVEDIPFITNDKEIKKYHKDTPLQIIF